MNKKIDTALAQPDTKRSRNRFNRLTSKEWLPFQKSWFRFESKAKLYRDNLRFFTPAEDADAIVYYRGDNFSLCKDVAAKEQLWVSEKPVPSLQFAMVDLTSKVAPGLSTEEYESIKQELLAELELVYHQLAHRRFLAVFIPNVQEGSTYLPFAWDLAKHIATLFSLKDEKIACCEASPEAGGSFFQPEKSFFYCLYFRKDEHSTGTYTSTSFPFFRSNVQPETNRFSSSLPAWFILKPQPRKKHEILHPAKYPEDLPELFLPVVTREGANVFDPMSGTGSTQLAALRLNRNGYGTELSEFFATIANERCSHFLSTVEGAKVQCRIAQADARTAAQHEFPAIDYMITSPPYWDMLNMKGAENQAKRIEKGLQTNYSEDEADLGNIAAYHDFLDELTAIYRKIIPLMKPGSFLTIVVKNIKKKGRNYPFAWDLALALQEHLILLPEVFWCQDDISIAPYGYGNTWVSNTFHQYCLTFQKPH